MASRSAQKLLIDTNLLLLLVAGFVEDGNVSQCKKTSHYTQEDFSNLCGIINKMKYLVTTAHFLTETNSLINTSYSGRKREEALIVLKKIIIEKAEELVIPATTLSDKHSYFQFGLADSALAHLLREKGIIVLTDDGPILHYLQSQKLSAYSLKQRYAI